MAALPTTRSLPGEHPEVIAATLAEHARTGGSTVDPRSGQNLSGSRYHAVGVSPESSSLHDAPPTPEDYASFVAGHRDILSRHSNSAVGTQQDPKSGLHRIEIVAVTPSKTAALNMAAHLGEDHTYHLGTDEPTPTGATGREPSHLSIDERLQQVHSQSPQRTPYSGTHFSDQKLDFIDGSRRGSSATPGAEATRLRLGSQTGLGKDAPGGFYTYKAGSLPEAQVAARKNAHQVRGQFAFASTDHPAFQNGYDEGSQHAQLNGADAKTAHHLGLNAGEHALRDAGYDGYFSESHPNIRFHFDSAETVPVGAKQTPQLDASDKIK